MENLTKQEIYTKSLNSLKRLTIATRASDLALWQANYIKDKLKIIYPDMDITLNKIVSQGDKILDKPLSQIGGKGHFTKELEDAMLEGEADMAVHSLKDVPTYMPDGLELAAITKREDQSDIFLSHKYERINSLPKKAIVGTTSLRRRMQLLKIRPDLTIKELRGNVNTRLKKLSSGQYDAIILAYIGLERLNLIKNIPHIQKLPLDMMIPPMGQASLGIQIVSNNDKLREIAKKLNDKDSYLCASMERDFIAKIEAGCSSPVACHAFIDDDIINMEVLIGLPDGTQTIYHKATSLVSSCENMGRHLAVDCIASGAKELLSKAEVVSNKLYEASRL